MDRLIATAFFIALLCQSPVSASHHRIFILTGQSNALGTTNGSETDVSPGTDPADARVRFFWHNVADAAVSIGDSGGQWLGLQPQQGAYYPGSASHWGPEIGLARTLVRAGVENPAIIKASRGGGGNTHWSKDAGGHMYSHVVATVAAATGALTAAGDTYEIVGLLYLQGESDSAAEAEIAGTRIKELVNHLRADLPNASNLKAAIAGIAAPGTSRDTVRARHEVIADATPYIDFFPNLDLQSSVTDGLHFNKEAKLRIGSRFAMASFSNDTVARHYGKLAFIGDSITQGGNGDRPSYRYQVFKRLAEAGVAVNAAAGYQFTGSVTGPQTTPILTTPDVNGQVFENVHDGHYGWRASWISARVPLPANRRSNNRGEGTLLNWTGQAEPQVYQVSGPDSTVPYPDLSASGTGNTGTTYVPDTVSIMTGINDLGDDNPSANQVIADIGTMIDQVRAANPGVRVFLNQLLYTNQTQAMRDAVDAVNAQLPALAAAKNAGSASSPVWVIDSNTGFDPVAMTYDSVHPNALGESHVGDHIAAALGIIADPPLPASPTPPHLEMASADFDTRYEGNRIWNGTSLVNGWTQTGVLTRSLPEPSDLRLIHPSTDGRWIEGTTAGWNTIAAGSWTFETRLKFDANPNGFVLWFGVGTQRIIVEVHGNRTQDIGGESFNTSHNNLDGGFHVFRIAHDASNRRYHVFRDGQRLTPLAGAAYDQSGSDSRLILGDYTSGTFGNQFDVTLDHIRFTPGSFLPAGLDSDGNGMPDAWEYRYFHSLTGAEPDGDPDEDSDTNLQEFLLGTDPLVADARTTSLPVFLFAGGGNAEGTPGNTPFNSQAPGQHPAEQNGGIRIHDGTGWNTPGSGPAGPETAFARMLWDSGFRDFGIVKSTTTGGGNSLWEKSSADDSAYQALVAAASSAAASPPAGFGAVSFRALVFIQGEQNDTAEAEAAGTRFASLLENLKSDLPNAGNLHAILGEIGGSGTTRDTTRSRHATLAAGRPDIGLARNTGLATHNDDGLAIHYPADSLFLLGARLAAEAIRMNLTGTRPLPAWENLHAWFIADHGTLHDSAGAVTRWATVHEGGTNRDLSRRVAGQAFRRTVTTTGGRLRQVMRFDGSNDLWSNATTEFGALGGARTVAMLCRLSGVADGFLFDGTTHTGRTRAQVRGGSWQAGVTPTGSSIAWNLAEPATTTATTGWQRHVFTYTPNVGNTATTIAHWIDGTLVATVSENENSALGGLIIGANGGSPFSRLAVDVAEVAVFSKSLDASEVSALDAAWTASWGTPSGPPLAARVRQTAREIPRFGWHPVLEIEIDAPADGIHTLTGIDLELRESAPGTASRWRLLPGPRFNPSAAALAEIVGSPAVWSPELTLPLVEGLNTIFVVVEPSRHAPLGATLDAAAGDLTITGAPALGPSIPSDPAGALALALVPLFNDVVRSGDLGIHTFRIPGIVTDKHGVLHAVYDHRYTGSGDLPGNIDVGYSRSSDGGATWSTSQVILDFDSAVSGSSGNGVGDPSILYDPATDTLWTAALWSFGNRAYNGSGPGLLPAETGQYVLTKSSDGGQTWSPPINITAQVKDPAWRLLFCGPGHGITLRDGTLVFPSQMRREGDGLVRMCFVFSRDHGDSWQFGSVVPDTSPQTNENELLELDDGRLLFSGRTPSGSNGQRAWSHFTPAAPAAGIDPLKDGSWSPIYRLPSVPDPVCQATVTHWKSTHAGHPREWILFANPATGGRNGMTIRLSQDGGLTWPVSRLLYAGSSAYSCLTTLPDGSIGLFFERDDYTRITFARVEDAWLMNPGIDSDKDRIPDAWESLHRLDPNSPGDASLDPDGDSASNLDEFLAGTDPTNPVSRLRVTGLEVPASRDRLFLDFAAVPTRAYTIEASAKLDAWSSLATLTADRPAMQVEIETDPAADRHFFRVRAER
jgi:lysophospholipase L1-like esterase